MCNSDRKPVSVCMALYNGANFVQEQLESILPQLNIDGDELIIIDDCSKDNSIEIISSYKHPSIQILKNEQNLGYIKTFEKAISKTSNSVIFLTDQDDIWMPNRLIEMYNELMDTDKLLICSNFNSFDSETKSAALRFRTRLSAADSSKNLKNILSIFRGNIAYFGCTMAFKSGLKKYILPFPRYIDAHDLWIAMQANVLGKVIHLEKNTLQHRIHNNNTSFVKRSLTEKLYTRLLFFRTFLEAIKRKNQ